MTKVKIVDAGECFGNDHWYMFYCPACSATIDMNLPENKRLICERCGEKLDYPKEGDK